MKLKHKFTEYAESQIVIDLIDCLIEKNIIILTCAKIANLRFRCSPKTAGKFAIEVNPSRVLTLRSFDTRVVASQFFRRNGEKKKIDKLDFLCTID